MLCSSHMYIMTVHLDIDAGLDQGARQFFGALTYKVHSDITEIIEDMVGASKLGFLHMKEFIQKLSASWVCTHKKACHPCLRLTEFK